MLKDLKENLDLKINTFLLGVCWLFTILNLFFQSIKISTIPSLLLKANIVIIFLWFAFSVFYTIKKKDLFKNRIKFLSTCILFTIIVLCFVNLLIVKKGLFGFDFLNKYLITINTLLFVYLVTFEKVEIIKLRWLVFISFFFGVFLFLSYLTGYGRQWRGLTSSGSLTLNFYNPNFAAEVLYFIVIYLVMGVFLFKNKLVKAAFIIIILTSLFLMIKTGSRNPLLALFLGLIISYLVKFFGKKHIFKYSLFVSYFPLLFASLYIIIMFIINKEEFTFVFVNGKNIDTRFDVWTNSFKAFLRHPIFGSYSILNDGSGSFQLHNSHIDFLVAYGLFPFLLLLVFLALVLYNCFCCSFNHCKVTRFVVVSAILFGVSEAAFLSSGSSVYIIAFTPIAFLINYLQDNFFLANNHLIKKDNIIKPNLFKVLQINSVYKYGSTGSLVFDHHTNLCKDGVDSYVIYGRGKSIYEYNVLKIGNELYSKFIHLLCNVFKNPSAFGYLNTLKIISIINSIEPDIVHVHCLNDYYVNEKLLLKYLNRKRIKTVYTLHSEMVYLGNCGGNAYECYKWRIKPGCDGCALRNNFYSAKKIFRKKYLLFRNLSKKNFVFTAVSPWLHSRARDSIILNGFDVLQISNGVNIDLFPDLKSTTVSTKKIGFITASFDNPNKGGSWLYSLADSFKNNKDIEFCVISLAKTTVNQPLENIVFYGSFIDKTKLYSFISECCVTLTLSKSETFGMPVIESLCCGTPVAGFDSGGPSSVAIEKYSRFVEYGNIPLLHDKIEDLLRCNYDKVLIQKESKEKYSNLIMTNEYKQIYGALKHIRDIRKKPSYIDFFEVNI